MVHVIQIDFSRSWASAVFKGLREGARLVQHQNETEDWFDGLFMLEHLEEIFGTTCVVAQTYMNRTWADITKIKTQLGWAPQVSFEEGVQRILANIEYWRQAPLWDPDSIAEATNTWHSMLSSETYEHR